VQCDSCIPGWGPFKDGSCKACPPGTAKNRISPKECDFCLDGFIANAPEGATDCLDNTRRRRSRAMLESGSGYSSSGSGYSSSGSGYSSSGSGYSGSGEEEYSSGMSEFEQDANRLCRQSLDTPAGFHAEYDAKINACTCPEGTKLKLVEPSIDAKTGETDLTGPSCELEP